MLEWCEISIKNMKKFIALLCVGAIALAGVNGFDAQAKKKKATKKVAKTERVATVKNAEQPKTDCQGTKNCEKKDAACPKLTKADGKTLKKAEGREMKKAECKGMKSECKDMKNECKEKAGECKGGECKKGEHKCAHKNPCCSDGACKMDGSCGKEKCKPGSEACCK